MAYSYDRRSKTSPLERIDAKSWYLPVQKDKFLHFTTASRAAAILKSGKLLMRPPHDKFGTDTVDAVSLTYGKLVPGVQFNHLKPGPEEPLAAVVFMTSTVPYIGYVEEVKWESDVHLKKASLVSLDQGKALLGRTPHKIDDQEYVLYKKPEPKPEGAQQA